MKKIISTILAMVMLCSVLTVFACAADATTVVSETVEYFEDGSYMVTTLTEDVGLLTRATATKSGSKTAVIYDSDNKAVVTLKLSATFSYTGSSATCTSATATYTIHDDAWKVTKAEATKSGNKAIGNFTAKKYVLGIPVKTENVTITITCSNTGTLS